MVRSRFHGEYGRERAGGAGVNVTEVRLGMRLPLSDGGLKNRVSAVQFHPLLPPETINWRVLQCVGPSEIISM
jgi:hypothetical protein